MPDVRSADVSDLDQPARPPVLSGHLTRLIRRDGDIVVNFTSLLGSSVLTSVLGFAYWWVAARGFCVEAVGASSAAISAMMVISMVGMFGMGTLLISELPRMSERRWNLVSACLIVSACAAGVLATGYIGLAWTIAPSLRVSVATPVSAILFIAGCTIGSTALVLDDVLLGLHVGPLQTLRNAWFAGGKLALLAILAVATATGFLAVSDRFGDDIIIASWLAGIIVSFWPLTRALRSRVLGVPGRPDLRLLRTLRKDAVDHNVLNMMLFLPRTILPLIVTLVLSTKATAPFYAAWMLLTFLTMIPSHLATTLFAIASGDQSTLRNKIRTALLISLVLGIPIAVILAVASHPIMGMFGKEYASAGAGVLAILALTYPGTVFRQLFVAVSRVRRQIRRAIVYACAFGVLEITAAWYGGSHGGLTGLASWVAMVFFVEGLITAPIVIRACTHH